MKKILFILFCSVASIGTSAQTGKVSVNAGFLFVSKFYPYLLNVVCNPGLVLQRIVQKEIVTDGIDIVDVCPDSVFV